MRTHYRFICIFGSKAGQIIGLDAAALRLWVDRRRVYDIVDVLESLGVAVRRARNSYIWEVAQCVEAKVEDLRLKAQNDLFGTPDDFRLSKKRKSQRSQPPMVAGLLSQESDRREGTASRKEKHIGVLSQRLV